MHLKSNIFNRFTHNHCHHHRGRHHHNHCYCCDIESIFLKGRRILIKMCKQSNLMMIKQILVLALTFHLLFAKQLIAEAENDDTSKQVNNI